MLWYFLQWSISLSLFKLFSLAIQPQESSHGIESKQVNLDNRADVSKNAKSL